jgi:Replication-relaxation
MSCTDVRALSHHGAPGTVPAGTAQPGPVGRPAAPDRGLHQVIATLLVEHRALTTNQIAAVLFTCVSAARTRLCRLRAKGWVYSFTSVRPEGPVEAHWTAGTPAARYVAARDGDVPPTPRAGRQRVEAMAASAHLAHTVGANQVFVDLIAQARNHPGTRLARWWGPARAAAARPSVCIPTATPSGPSRALTVSVGCRTGRSAAVDE